jgi:transposase
MTREKKTGSKRSRRTFSPEFKLEAVRLWQERRAAGASLAQVGRELDVRPHVLGAWARQVTERPGTGARDGFPGQGQGTNTEAEVRRLQRELATLRQERDFLKKRRRSSRKSRGEVRLHRPPSGRVSGATHVPRA